jgi:hypothetical protein
MSQITLRTGLLSHPQYWRWLQMLMCLQIRRFLLWIEQLVCSGDAFLVPAQRRRLGRASRVAFASLVSLELFGEDC